jgi:hypothetical protein
LRLLKLGVALLACLVGVGAVLIMTNPAPDVPAIPSGEAGSTSEPWVVKLHARWCPVCMVTKDEWADLQEAYSGQVRLVVFDFTSAETTEVSRSEARRLGLDAVFEEYVGETGTVLVLDGATKAVEHVLHGNRGGAEYRAAIDAALGDTLEAR